MPQKGGVGNYSLQIPPEPPEGPALWSHCPSWSPECWMGDLFSVIGKRSITEIHCVGSHNSGTYGIARDSPFASDAPSFLQGCCSCFTRCLFRGTVTSWATCQTKSILKQLEHGIRYLDLRVIPHEETNELITTHGVYGATIKDIVLDVVHFLNSPRSEKEFLIIDFQHIFCSPEYLKDSFFPQIKPILDHCVTRNCGLQQSLEELLQCDPARRVFLFIGSHFDVEQQKEVFPRCFYLDSSWKNVTSSKELCEALDQDVSGAATEYAAMLASDSSPRTTLQPPPRVSVTQAIITADAELLVKRGCSSCCCCSQNLPLERISSELNAEMVLWFVYWNSQTKFVDGKTIPRCCGTHRNVLLLDFPEIGLLHLQVGAAEISLTAVGWCIMLNILYG